MNRSMQLHERQLDAQTPRRRLNSSRWPALLLLVLWAGCKPAPEPPTRARSSSAPPNSTTSNQVADSEVPKTWTEEQVHAALRSKNPAYNGQAVFQIDHDQVVIMQLTQTGVTDLSSLRGMPLKALDLRQTQVADITPLRGMPLVELYLEETLVGDLSPLQGAPLTRLYLSMTPVADLGPLRGMPLGELNLLGTQVTDLSPLRGMPLEMLWLNETPVSDISFLSECPLISLTLHRTLVRDLSPLANSGLQRLHIGETPVTDLTPIKNLRLTRLVFTPERIDQGLEVVRQMASLRELGETLEEVVAPPLFWSLHPNLAAP